MKLTFFYKREGCQKRYLCYKNRIKSTLVTVEILPETKFHNCYKVRCHRFLLGAAVSCPDRFLGSGYMLFFRTQSYVGVVLQ